jgi:hypothetical protein
MADCLIVVNHGDVDIDIPFPKRALPFIASEIRSISAYERSWKHFFWRKENVPYTQKASAEKIPSMIFYAGSFGGLIGGLIGGRARPCSRSQGL